MVKHTRSLHTRTHRSSVSFVKSPYTKTKASAKFKRNKPRRTATYKLLIKSVPKLKHSHTVKIKNSQDLDDFRVSPTTKKMTQSKLSPSKSKRAKQDFLDDFGEDTNSH